MKETISDILGALVTSASKSYETISIVFDNGILLAIHSKASMTGGELGDIVGHRVADVTDAADELKIRLENAIQIRVDMTEAGYTGPERLQLSYPSGRIEAW